MKSTFVLKRNNYIRGADSKRNCGMDTTGKKKQWLFIEDMGREGINFHETGLVDG